MHTFTMKKYIHIITLTAAAIALLLSGCNSVPMVYERPSAPTRILPIDFNATERPVNLNRGKLSTQDAVAYTNWTWFEGGHRSDYQLSARALTASLEAGDFLDNEEQLRLSVMAIQSALIAGDTEAMRIGTLHWEEAYAGLGRISYAGEVETYLIACRISGREPLSEVRYRANMTITQALKD